MKKNSAIDQVMDELNEEVQSSLQPSPDLFTFHHIDDNVDNAGEKNQNNTNLASLIHFTPRKMGREEKQENRDLAPDNKVKSPKKALKPFSTNKSSSRKKNKDQGVASTPDNNLFKKKDVSLKKDKKSTKEANKFKINFSLKSRAAQQAPLSNMAYELEKRDQNIPMKITLQQSENLRVAQDRIIELEAEIDRLRTENEELIATGDIFRERLDKVIAQNDNLKKVYEENREEFQNEKRTLTDTLNDQSREIEKMIIKNKELEKRLSSNIQQIRVRERELENRLELMKLDNQTLAREKDRYILDLKRNIDKIKMDLDSQKNKYNEVSHKLEGYRNQNRRVTRGLQMILHIARGSNLSSEQKMEEEGEDH
ncbi:MAG: hypothetical protein OXM55_05270 [Bdellovibrionales bacterium]|nr:hypothetical protein [Bdellovibrionales bacterium]